jgi:hypothetical protein
MRWLASSLPKAGCWRPGSLFGWPFWLVAWFVLSAGYLATMGLGLLAVRRRGYRVLLVQIPLSRFIGC